MNKAEEKQLREFVRKTFVNTLLEQKRQEQLVERKVRLYVRSLIKEIKEKQDWTIINEARDATNPHPNTGINKLRDAIRKAKPSIKTKFQQLTSAPEQRESFSNHLLAAFVRLFDQLDALSASNEVTSNAEQTAQELGSSEQPTGDLAAPPDDAQLEKELEDEIGIDLQLESILKELNLNEIDEVEDDEADANDIVSDELNDEKETEKNKNLSQVEKDVAKKKDIEAKRQEFGKGLDGDATGRNQAFDTFNLVQTYFSDNYLDLDSQDDKEMYKKWALYNLKLLLDSYEEELAPQLQQPNIPNPT
jgi:hypothetical protein